MNYARSAWVIGMAMSFSVAAEEPRVSLPADYKETFVEYLSLDRVMNPDQFIRLFANPIALRGPNAQGELEDGSVLVAEVYSVEKDDTGQVKTTALNRRIAQDLVLIAVMEKQTEFAQTPASAINLGGWDMGAYTPAGHPAAKNLDACRACHAPLGERDFVFSLEHIRR